MLHNPRTLQCIELPAQLGMATDPTEIQSRSAYPPLTKAEIIKITPKRVDVLPALAICRMLIQDAAALREGHRHGNDCKMERAEATMPAKRLQMNSRPQGVLRARCRGRSRALSGARAAYTAAASR